MKMKELDFSSISQKDAYRFLIGGIVPRPIAWVSTTSKSGITNLAPFSFFTGVCSNPPSLLFCPANHPDSRQKDTLKNCLETKQFVVNVTTSENADLMNQTAAPYDPNMSEFEALKIESIPSVKIRPPRVKNSPLHFECEVIQVIPVGQGSGSGNVVIGKILYVHVSEDVYENGRILIEKLMPIARLAGSSYCKIGEIFDLKRPSLNQG